MITWLLMLLGWWSDHALDDAGVLHVWTITFVLGSGWLVEYSQIANGTQCHHERGCVPTRKAAMFVVNSQRAKIGGLDVG